MSEDKEAAYVTNQQRDQLAAVQGAVLNPVHDAGPDPWMIAENEQRDKDRNERLRLASLEASLRTAQHQARDEADVLRTARAYLAFLDGSESESGKANGRTQ